MNIDSQELREVAATADTADTTAASAANPTAGQSPRPDMYAGIHKALRSLMCDNLVALGRMDCDDDLVLAQVTQRVVELLDFCRAHLQHENDFVHVAIEARAPGASGVIAHEHEEHVAHITRLQREVEALRALPVGARDLAALELYRHLALFIAENFQHMHVEETAHNAVLWARYTDAELGAIHDALVASIPPDEMMFVLRWMVPAMNPAERAGMLAGMKAHAPAPAFEAALAIVRPHLGEREWEKLARALGIAPAPGLVG